MCQQHPQFLTAYRLHMHRTIKPRPHHLRYAARIVAVRLVDLRLQHRVHVPRLNADHRQSCFGESAEQPLRQRSSFQPDSLEVVSEVLQHRQQCFRFARHLYFPNDLACVIHNADARLLDRNVQSSKMVHAARYSVLAHLWWIGLPSGSPAVLVIFRESVGMMVANTTGSFDLKGVSGLRGWAAWGTVALHATTGLFMTLVILARFVSLLPKPGTQEIGERQGSQQGL